MIRVWFSYMLWGDEKEHSEVMTAMPQRGDIVTLRELSNFEPREALEPLRFEVDRVEWEIGDAVKRVPHPSGEGTTYRDHTVFLRRRD